ncbi:hypothetical protein K5Y32_07085 [Pantoea sp. DY-15]|uniref:hypothetical protein n=1 Tax=Pantoea sp. DY-15 TaxID=2871489 RepID=UPI001C94056C|nr:hypothetical protein [Pantoea sp. DY-15]MBY4887695.1 hypothetical protein [Pantoea sp. DY-15]
MKLKTHSISIIAFMLTAMSLSAQATENNNQSYYDFKNKRMVSKDEFEREQSKIAECSDWASRMVQARIADGSIPLASDVSNNADWQRAFHSEYVKKCMNEN